MLPEWVLAVTASPSTPSTCFPTAASPSWKPVPWPWRSKRPRKLALGLIESLQKLAGKPARVLVAGLGFKPGQSQVDNSPGVDLVRVLSVSQTVQVAWADALVKQEAMPQVRRLEDSEWPRECLMGFDVVVVAMKQEQMDFGLVDEVEVEGIRVERWCRW